MPDKLLNITLKNVAPAQMRAAVSDTLIEGATVSQWWRSQRDGFVTGVMREVRQGVRNGSSNAEIARQLQSGTFASHRSRANTLAATATNAVSTKARLDTFEENKDVIKGYQQVSTLDGRTSDTCIAYSGMAWDFEGKPLTPETTLPFNGGPPRHFNCRSTLVPVLKSFEELGLPPIEFPEGTRASLDGQVPGNITFAQFLKGKSKTFQDKLLGPGRAKLWREDKITLNQLVDMRGNPLTIEELLALSKVRKRDVPKPVETTALTFAREDQAPEITKDVDASFADTTDKTIIAAIRKAPPVAGVKISPNKGQGAYYDHKGTIYMWDRKGPHAKDRDYRIVFAHEYGHFLDDQIGQALKSDAGYGYASAKLHGRRAKDGRALRSQNQTTRFNTSQAQIDEVNKIGRSTADIKKAAKDVGLNFAKLQDDLIKIKLDPEDAEVVIQSIVAAIRAKDAGAVIYQALGRAVLSAKTTAARKLMTNVADFFGAMTKNRIGFGHSKSYYGKGRNLSHATNTEMFANYIQIRAQFPELANVLRLLSPNWTKGADKLLEDYVK